MPDWPTGVPFFNKLDEVEYGGPQNAVLRTEVDAGPDMVRRITSAAPELLYGTTRGMSLVQFQAFKAFFANDILMGALRFTAKDPMTCEDREFRFVGTYTARREGNKRYVSAQLEMLNA